MKALKLISPKVIKNIDLDIPKNIPKGHALIKINTISLCGSDYKLFYGNYSGLVGILYTLVMSGLEKLLK